MITILQRSVFFPVIMGVVLSFTLYAKTDLYDFPTPKYSILQNEYMILSKQTKFIVDDDFYYKYKASFDSLKKSIDIYSSDDKSTLNIIFNNDINLSKIDIKYRTYVQKKGAFLLDIKKSIIISARDDEGLLNALSTLEVLVETNKGKIQERMIVDFPDLKQRVLHLSMWPCRLDDFKSVIRLARLEHFNTLIWLNHFGAELTSLKHLRTKSSEKWSLDEYKQMIVFVQQNGLEIIPELKLLSHQKKFMGSAYPQYMYNKDTYDPRKKELYSQIVFPAIDELLLLTGATKFHIGHDEIAGWHEWHYRKNILNKNDKQLPPNLFLQDINTLYNYLKNQNIETWMWSDMLYTKKEFPSMKNAGPNLHGMNGYSNIAFKIPKDIVMNVWHYNGRQKSFPTVDTMLDYGHKTLGATWKFETTTRNYAKYIYSLNNKNAQGMIATTWFGLSGKNKEEVKDIIKYSGRAFWNAK